MHGMENKNALGGTKLSELATDQVMQYKIEKQLFTLYYTQKSKLWDKTITSLSLKFL